MEDKQAGGTYTSRGYFFIFFSSSLLQSFDFRLFAVHFPPILAGAFCVQWGF
jgi:hypothetical protein